MPPERSHVRLTEATGPTARIRCRADRHEEYLAEGSPGLGRA